MCGVEGWFCALVANEVNLGYVCKMYVSESGRSVQHVVGLREVVFVVFFSQTWSYHDMSSESYSVDLSGINPGLT